MQKIVIQPNQNPDKVAAIVGGTLIAINGNELLMVNADLSKLNQYSS